MSEAYLGKGKEPNTTVQKNSDVIRDIATSLIKKAEFLIDVANHMDGVASGKN